MITNYTDIHNTINDLNERGRGRMSYSSFDIQKLTGRDKDGKLLTWGVEQPFFYLTVSQRLEIFRLSSPVQGVVTSRMHRLAGLNFTVISEKYKEDEISQDLKDMKSLYDDYAGSSDLDHLVVKAALVNKIKRYLPDVFLDLSNFNSALIRWKRKIQRLSVAEAKEVKNWLLEPNNGVSWQEFVKKFVFDFMIHGSVGVYKQGDERLENFDTLAGGTVYRMKTPYFSGVDGYIQITDGYQEPIFYFSDEIAYSEYVPVSSRGYGFVPLEALINKITESLFFDQRMASQADGSKPPEKMVIVTKQNPFGSLDSMDIPLDRAEQKRLEEKLKQPVKEGIMTFSGNSVEVVDLTRSETMGNSMQRQKDIREEVALVFNMSNMEVNLTGGDETSGRSTSMAQQEIEQGKGISPIAKQLENLITRQILPYRYGEGYVFEFELGKDDLKQRQLDQIKLQTGELTKNELREKYGLPGYGEDYDKPDGAGQEAYGSEMNPLNTRSI